MKPGRELDAVVAEKVMGWRLIPSRQGKYAKYGRDIQGEQHEVPHYSTDIADAWEVVERFARESPIEIDTHESWRVCLSTLASSVTGDTGPHAICLAALRAVGHEL